MSHSASKKSGGRIPVVDMLNGVVKRIAELAAWLNVVLIGVIIISVIWRYGFNNALVELEELTWHLYAVAFMFGIAYCISNDSHIRVDLVHMNVSRRTQHIIEILGIVILLLPFLISILDHSLSWVADSYRVDEHSSSPTGLPHRWIIKGFLPAAFFLMLLAALARLIQEVLLLLHLGTEPEELDPGRVTMIKKLFHVHPEALYRDADVPAESTRKDRQGD
ncbi:MAG TPA: TRAP transporter small permease subunit [Denitromonas sp.]|uniref:TRAP transporter small permease subunit n=1 Tax=Denitromonas sp. TaxID=2734609 RepID=UPI001D63107B|nr:TRAP transporter small permease subunit [Rhodocyclaceae bacterium]MCP5222578.1 TRAP transporter small permease subunit [Zoogloeaceae bacterium]HPR06071.1 TRAP transporter small permease subunit [Denitromonas sp.]HQU88534.1 TRAP transporter small permease subunit [Denitromonas sp.]HQV14908.1 TRAP transporter small permease subunit [Denitromonas sp.]